MGGRGAYSEGKALGLPYTYETVGMIDGVKVLEPVDKTLSLKLPEESHTAGNRYILLDKDGIFHQYREYDQEHKVILEIGYHNEPKLGKGDVLHAHIHKIPGVEGHISAEKIVLKPGDSLYEKYKNLFVGIKR